MPLDDKVFGIWATVSGGVTGYRAAWSKSRGKVLTFTDRTEAERLAADYRERSSGSTAQFTYTVQEYTEGDSCR